MIDDSLLEVLACPRCVTHPDAPPEGMRKGQLERVGEKDAPSGLRCRQCGRTYKIDEDGIPHLLLDEATAPPESD